MAYCKKLFNLEGENLAYSLFNIFTIDLRKSPKSITPNIEDKVKEIKNCQPDV